MCTAPAKRQKLLERKIQSTYMKEQTRLPTVSGELQGGRQEGVGGAWSYNPIMRELHWPLLPVVHAAAVCSAHRQKVAGRGVTTLCRRRMCCWTCKTERMGVDEWQGAKDCRTTQSWPHGRE